MPTIPPNRVAAPSTSETSAQRYASLLDEARQLRGVSLGRDAWRRLKRNKAAMISLGFLVLLVLTSIFAPLLPFQSYIKQDLANRQSQPPNLASVSLAMKDVADAEAWDAEVKRNWHELGWVDRVLVAARLRLFGDFCIPSLCGTDNLGRDVLARLVWGSRVSLTVGVVATLVSLLIGVSYGAVAGYLGGWADALMMRLVDVLYSIPFIFVVIFIITFLRDEAIQENYLKKWHVTDTIAFYLLIGMVFWLTMARVVRGQVLSLKQEQFVEGARASGAGRMRIVFVHLIPNCLGIVVVYLTLTIPSVMLFEAFLSYLGLGVSAPKVSWGILASDVVESITPVKVYWWLVLFPSSTLAGTLFSLNFLGDGLRDALDPKMKNRG